MFPGHKKKKRFVWKKKTVKINEKYINFWLADPNFYSFITFSNVCLTVSSFFYPVMIYGHIMLVHRFPYD